MSGDPELSSPRRARLAGSQVEFDIVHKLDDTPACPGVIKARHETKLAKLGPESDVFKAFAKLRADKSLTGEEAFLELLATYDISIASMSKICATKLDTSFSNILYEQVAPYVWLDPNEAGGDMHLLPIFRSRIPTQIFRAVIRDVNSALTEYGPLASHDTEEARSRFIMSLFKEIVCLFESLIVNKPEGLLDGAFTKKGRIEHHFIALKSISIVFMEVKKTFVDGRDGLNMKAQVLAECAACDYANHKAGYWVPILAILCDGNNFEYFVYDSGDRAVHRSGRIPGLIFVECGDQVDFLRSLKKTTEYLFDWFIMAYINGIRAFGDRSIKRSKTSKRLSTENWQNALIAAEKAHWMLREAAISAEKGPRTEAEKMAEDGVALLKFSVSELASQRLHKISLESLWDGSECLEDAFEKN